MRGTTGCKPGRKQIEFPRAHRRVNPEVSPTIVNPLPVPSPKPAPLPIFRWLRLWMRPLAMGWFCLGLTIPGMGQEEESPESGTAAGPAAEGSEPTSPETAGEPAVDGLDSTLGLLFVSKASSPKVYAPVEGAKTTVLAPASNEKYGPRLFSKEAWAEKGLAWNDFYRGVVKRADGIVDAIEPDFRRDSRGVIDYALIESENPWLSTAVLSERFLPRFEREFGERLHVILIDRHRIFVFPVDGGKLASYAPALADLYHDETVIRHPVSLEIFLIDKEGFRVVGEIEN